MLVAWPKAHLTESPFYINKNPSSAKISSSSLSFCDTDTSLKGYPPENTSLLYDWSRKEEKKRSKKRICGELRYHVTRWRAESECLLRVPDFSVDVGRVTVMAVLSHVNLYASEVNINVFTTADAVAALLVCKSRRGV